MTYSASYDPFDENSRREPRVIFQEYLGKFGDAIRLLDSKSIRPASKERIAGFYKGQLLDWDIIAADADIHRDQLNEVLDRLRRPATGLSMLCITGPGIIGKSTLAWRAAFTLQREGANVLHVRFPGVEELWPLIPEFVTRVEGQVFVLVDDPFRDALQSLKAQELNVPLTILATSRTSDYKELGFPDESAFPIKVLSSAERGRLLEKTGITAADLEAERAIALRAARHIVDVLVVLFGDEARSHKQRIEDLIRAIRDPSSPDYSLARAYEYVCFTWQLFTPVPRPLIERLDSSGSFYGLNERTTAQDLIDYGNDAYRGKYHPVITAKVASEYAKFRNPKAVLVDIASKVNEQLETERQFLAVFLSRILVSDEPAAAALLPFPDAVTKKAQDCADAADSITSLSYWIQFYKLMGQSENVRTFVNRTSNLRPKSEIECSKLKLMWQLVGDEQRAFPAISEWVKKTGNRTAGLTNYLNLLKRADRPTVQHAIDEQLKLAKERPTDLSARAALLSLINARGINEQRDAAVEQALLWLSEDQDQQFVHECLLALLKKRSNPQLREKVIVMTKERLAKPPSNKALWDGLLSLLGSEWRNEDLRTLTQQAIANHPDDVSILRRAFFAFNWPADEPYIRSIHSRLRKLVHPDRADLWLADWLHHCSDWGKAVEIYERLEFSAEIESDNDAYVNFYFGWGDCLLYLGNVEGALKYFQEAAKGALSRKKRPSVAAILGQAFCHWQLHQVRQAEACFWSAKKAAQMESHRFAVAKNLPRVAMRLGFFYCWQKRFREARDLFDEAIKYDSTYSWNFFGAGCCAVLLDHGDASSLLDRALQLKPEKEDWHKPNHWRGTGENLLRQAEARLRPDSPKPLVAAVKTVHRMLFD